MAVGAVVQGVTPTVFTTLMEPQVRMAVWSRPAPNPVDAPDLFEATCDGMWIAPSGPAPDWLLDDIQGLGDILAAVSGGPMWRARFQTTTTRVCPRFHQDAVSVRLIATYQGLGSEWAFASEIGHDLNARRAETRRRVRTLDPGDIAIMKGSAEGWAAWPEFPVVLHRSPPANRRAIRRVLTIDAVTSG
jgi:hypothetical protein